MKTYICNADILHGVGAKIKAYKPGQPIDLEDEDAQPLLARGDIEAKKKEPEKGAKD